MFMGRELFTIRQLSIPLIQRHRHPVYWLSDDSPMTTSKLSVWRWKVNRRPEQINPFLGRYDMALAWLREASADAQFESDLRQLLMDSGLSTASAKTGLGLLEEVARQLSTGELHLAPEFSPAAPSAEEIFFLQPDVQVTPATFQTSTTTTTPVDPPTFPPATSQLLAAQCLEKSSEDGSAFCAECQPDQ